MVVREVGHVAEEHVRGATDATWALNSIARADEASGVVGEVTSRSYVRMEGT